MVKSRFAPILVLTAICIAAALLLSVINIFTAPIIKDRQNAAANEALLVVLPDGSNFKPLEVTADYPSAVSEAYSADGGFVFRVTGAGKMGDIVMMVGVDTEGKIVGTKVIAQSETEGYGEKVYVQVEGTDGHYAGQTLDTFDPLTIAKATGSSDGVRDAIKAALMAYIVANGGAVDNRTPEQILKENCNIALGTTDKTFEEWFVTEILVGIDKVYEATDGSGFVFMIGESFVGVNSTGVTTPDIAAENAQAAETAYAIVSTSGDPTPVSIAGLNLPISPINYRECVLAAYVTATGNYVFELEAYGFYADYGTNMNITVCISSEGKIIGCKTTYCDPDEGFGSISSDTYYDKWLGADSDKVVISPDSDATDPGVVSGATYTTQGYQTAIKAAFLAFNALTAQEGGNQ